MILRGERKTKHRISASFRSHQSALFPTENTVVRSVPAIRPPQVLVPMRDSIDVSKGVFVVRYLQGPPPPLLVVIGETGVQLCSTLSTGGGGMWSKRQMERGWGKQGPKQWRRGVRRMRMRTRFWCGSGSRICKAVNHRQFPSPSRSLPFPHILMWYPAFSKPSYQYYHTWIWLVKIPPRV